MSYSHTPHFQQIGLEKNLRAHTESDIDYPYSHSKEFSLQKRLSKTIDREEEEQNSLKDSIQKRLNSLKKQLGMEKEESEDERYISKMDRFTKKIDRSLDQKDVIGVVRHRNEFERQLAVHKDHKDDAVNTSMSKKLDERSFERKSFAPIDEKRDFERKSYAPVDERKSYVSIDEKKDNLSRAEHERILEIELRKLENRFFGLFEVERKENAEKLLREKDAMEAEIKKKYEDKIFELEFRVKQSDSLSKHNEELLIQCNEYRKRDDDMTEEIAKLREIIETDRNASNDNNWQGDREKQLLDKIDELESHRRKLLDDVQDYKNDLKTLKEDIQKDEEIYQKCLDKLKKYQDKCKKLIERNEELENDNHELHDQLTYAETMAAENELNTTKKRSRSKGKTEEKRQRSASKGRKRSMETLDNTTNTSLLTLNLKDNQVRELRDEIRHLNSELMDLKQRNIDLNNKNLDLENELRVLENPGNTLDRAEYSDAGILGLVKKDNEIRFWRDKCESLVRKYLEALRNLKEENKKMKSELLRDVKDLKEETELNVKKLKKMNKKCIEEMEGKVGMYKEKYIEYLSHKLPPERTIRSKSVTKGKTIKK